MFEAIDAQEYATADPMFRSAVEDDLVATVTLLADDELAAAREYTSIPLDPRYRTAFAAIAADPNQLLLVAADGDAGRWLPPDNVHSRPVSTGDGAWADRELPCGERTSRRRRRSRDGRVRHRRMSAAGLRGRSAHDRQVAAHRFYARLGFVASHEGMKRAL